jgi:hypothetical protein
VTLLAPHFELRIARHHCIMAFIMLLQGSADLSRPLCLPGTSHTAKP